MMGPPPRPGPGYSQHRMSQGHVRTPGGELSLTLPPLQTVNGSHGQLTGHVNPAHASTISGHSDSTREAGNKKSLPEAIMSIPFQHKIGILRRITPPLPSSGQRSRAMVIAVEGDSAAAAKNLTDWLEEWLGRERDMIVKVIDGPQPSQVGEDGTLEAADLFQAVIKWHARNKEIMELVQQGSGRRKDSARSVSGVTSGGQVVDEEQTVHATETSNSAMEIDSHGTEDSCSARVVILLRTYTLTASNFFASGIPIQDVYRPDDHWQWTATMWRSILGPDLTIYIRDVEGTGSATARDEGGKGGVEIVEEAKMNSKFMAIRRTYAGDGGHDKGGLDGVEAGTLRRLGFEVGEWVRSATVVGTN